MEFVHKNVKITVGTDGLFYFMVGKNCMKADSLNNAKARIDTLLKSYYTFTKDDFKRVMFKLDDREKTWLKDLITNFECHRHNAYCEIGVETEFDNNAVFDIITSDK